MRTREKGQAAFGRGIQLGAAIRHAPRSSFATDSNFVRGKSSPNQGEIEDPLVGLDDRSPQLYEIATG